MRKGKAGPCFRGENGEVSAEGLQRLDFQLQEGTRSSLKQSIWVASGSALNPLPLLRNKESFLSQHKVQRVYAKRQSFDVKGIL